MAWRVLTSSKRNDIPNETLTAADFLQASVLPSSSHDLYVKEMRVKAVKTFQWLVRPGTVFELLLTSVTIAPLERVMWAFMKMQSDSTNNLLDPNSSPITKMSSIDSPARLAIDQLLDLMSHGRFSQSADGLDLMTLASFLAP